MSIKSALTGEINSKENSLLNAKRRIAQDTKFRQSNV